MTRPNITRRGMVGGISAGVGLAAAAASGEIVSTAHGQSTPKTFVLVHGAWHGGWCWRRVSDLLERKGHKVFAPTLTGLGERSHLLGKDVNLDTHITDLVNVFKWEDLRNSCRLQAGRRATRNGFHLRSLPQGAAGSNREGRGRASGTPRLLHSSSTKRTALGSTPSSRRSPQAWPSSRSG
jgi:hypothetical protein